MLLFSNIVSNTSVKKSIWPFSLFLERIITNAKCCYNRFSNIKSIIMCSCNYLESIYVQIWIVFLVSFKSALPRYNVCFFVYYKWTTKMLFQRFLYFEIQDENRITLAILQTMNLIDRYLSWLLLVTSSQHNIALIKRISLDRERFVWK